MSSTIRIIATFLLAAIAATAFADSDSRPVKVPGLKSPVKVIRDVDGIPHIIGRSEHDVIFMQGFVHAQDRFFQMDFSRRQASGTLAELVGQPALASDVQLRTFGLRRAAERTLAALSAETLAGLQAYADGVNFYLATEPLPPEYGILELTQADPWTPLDSVAIGKLIAFGLSFDLDIGNTEALLTYQGVGAALGFDGEALFFEDLFRTQPFDPAATVPDALAAPAASLSTRSAASAKERRSALTRKTATAAKTESKRADPAMMRLAREYIERVKGIPMLENALNSTDKPQGSNEWAVAPSRSASGKAMLANDPHLALNTPATWYQNHLKAEPDKLDAVGSSFPGVPYVTLGQNRRIAWGATVNPMDVTDTYQEQVVPDPGSPSGLSTIYLGSPEPLIPIPQVFRINVLDGVADTLDVAPPDSTVSGVFVPAVTLIVPRRNNGPIINIDLATGAALSVQYTGFSATREFDAFRSFNFAKDMDDFKAGLQFFDFGSQNFAYMDTDGNIAYFTSAEMPVREDLQAGTVVGLPPYFIRNGTGGNEWAPVSNPQPQQAVPYEILPFDEMPKLINPVNGYFINANNDPTGNTRDNNAFNETRPGGGIFYLNPGYAIGTRAGRITEGFEERLAKGPLSRADMEEIQADVKLLDAQVFTPLILDAFATATSPGADPALAGLVASDPRIAEAVARLAEWDYSTPTGVPEGYDSSDEDGERAAPSVEEVEHSIATTIYSVWRGQMIGNTIDATLDGIDAVIAPTRMPKPPSSLAMTALRNLFDQYDTQFGVGVSGVNFFNVPGVADPMARRDILILKSVQDALDLLAGPDFQIAFGGSTDQNDYRWGRLHRIVLDHPLGPPFDTPPAGGAFPASFPDLLGLAVDGGFGVVDASSHSARADSSNDFMFGSGPSRRYIGEASRTPRGIDGQTTLPGGVSGVLGSPLYANILGRWLTNDYYDIRQRNRDVKRSAASTQKFVPARKHDRDDERDDDDDDDDKD